MRSKKFEMEKMIFEKTIERIQEKYKGLKKID